MAATTNQRSQQEEGFGAKAQEFGAKVQEKGAEASRQFMDKAREVGSNIAEKAKEAGAQAGQRAEDATQSVGKRMESLAGTIRENLPTSGVIGAATSTVASGLENTGRYLEHEGLSGMANDVANLIRRNPLPALLLGVCAGFMIAKAVDRRS